MQLSRIYKLVGSYQEKDLNLLKNNLKYIDTYEKMELDNSNEELILHFDVDSGEEAHLVKEVSKAIKSSGLKLKAKTPFTKPGDKNIRKEKITPVKTTQFNDSRAKDFTGRSFTKTFTIDNSNKNYPLVKADEYPHIDFPFIYFNPVQSETFKYYRLDSNLLVSSSTSSGKTIIAEMMIGQTIAEGKKAVYLSPLKAISDEKNNDWTNSNHSFSGKKVSIVTGDYWLTEQRVEELNQADIIIMTTEMLGSRVRRISLEKNNWLHNVGCVVVDEAHMITMKSRGDKLEVALMSFSKYNPDAKIVLLSATMPNTHILGKWLSTINEKKTTIIKSDYRPCRLNIHYTSYPKPSSYFFESKNMLEKMLEITGEYKDSKFIVFVHSKKVGREVFDALKNIGEKVEYHNADLDRETRNRIERSFKDDEGIRIIVATSTLAYGINMPARRVLIMGTKRGMEKVDSLDIKQMVGRAGRLGYDEEGDAYILLKQDSFYKDIDYCQYIPDIDSQLKNEWVLSFHIVSEINEQNILNKNDLKNWYKRSFASVSSGKGLNDSEANKILKGLEKCLAITKNEDNNYSVTTLGRIASLMYFSPQVVFQLYKNFERLFKKHDINDEKLLCYALGNTDLAMESYVPEKYKRFTFPFYEDAKSKGFEFVTPTGSLFAYIYYACMNNLAEVELVDKFKLQYDIERISSVLKLINAKEAKWVDNKVINLITARIKYQVNEEEAELCLIPNIGAERSKQLYRAGISSIREFFNPENKPLVLKILRSEILYNDSLKRFKH